FGGQTIRSEGGARAALVAKYDIGKACRGAGKDRDRDVAANARFEPGHGADFRNDGLAHRFGWNERSCGKQRRDTGRKYGRNDETQSHETVGRRHGLVIPLKRYWRSARLYRAATHPQTSGRRL